MCESAPPRRSARAILAARWVPAMLVAIGLIASGTLVPLGAMEPAGQGRHKERQPTPRWFHSAAVVNDEIYVIGGVGADNQPNTSVEVYDPTTGRWAECASMPTARAGFGASAVGGKIYAVGGQVRRGDVDETLSRVEVYDTATNGWASAADLPTPRFFPASGVIDGRIYVVGGASSHGSASSQEERTRLRTPLSVVEVYDPASSRWTTKPDLANPRGWLSASVVAGRLYVIGGRSSAPEGGILEVDGALPGIEVYTPPD